MDDFVGRKDLIPPKRLRQLTRRSDLRGSLQTLSHFGAIILTGVILYFTRASWWCVPIFVVHGMLINYLFAAQHEFNHYTVFATRWINDVFNRITGFLVLYPRSQERWYHYIHHRHTQNWQRDPELLSRGEPYTLATYVPYLLGVTYWWGRVRRMCNDACGRVAGDYYTDAQRRHIVLEARAHLAGYALIGVASVYFASDAAWFYWLAPLLATKILHQLQNIAEHTGLVHVPDTVINTRTIKTSALMRWMAWNMQFHAAHHTYPAVPFWQLPKLHAEMVARLGFEPPTTGYLQFQWRFIAALCKAPEPASGVNEIASTNN
jgi:fatty acid desaturase